MEEIELQNMRKRIEDLEEQVERIENMIQKIVIILSQDIKARIKL